MFTRKSAPFLLTSLLLTVLSGSIPTIAQQAQFQAPQIPMLQPPRPGFVFPERQTLTFTVDWRVFTAGTAVFRLEQQGTLQKITATADTVGAVTMLFPVVDKFQSAFDIKTGCSTGFSKQLQEGRRKVTGDLSFDYAQGKQTQSEKNLVKGTSKTQTASIPACASSTRNRRGGSFATPIRKPLSDRKR